MDPSVPLLRRAGPSMEVILAFDIVMGVTFFFLIFSTLVAWFTGVQRIKMWYLLQLTSAGYCLSFLFLLGHQTGPEPPLHFCAYSAALIYAAPPAAASAALFFVIELHLRLSSALISKTMSDKFIYWVAWGIPFSHGLVFLGLFDGGHCRSFEDSAGSQRRVLPHCRQQTADIVGGNVRPGVSGRHAHHGSTYCRPPRPTTRCSSRNQGSGLRLPAQSFHSNGPLHNFWRIRNHNGGCFDERVEYHHCLAVGPHPALGGNSLRDTGDDLSGNFLLSIPKDEELAAVIRHGLGGVGIALPVAETKGTI